MTHTTIQKVKKFQVKTREQEHILVSQAQNGDATSYQELINNNIRLVINIARKFNKSKEDLEDLVGEGIIGLGEAIKRFDLTKQNKFSTYCSYWAYNRIAQFTRANTKSAYFPSYLINAAISVGKYQKEYFNLHDKNPSVAHLAKKFHYSAKTITRILSFFHAEESLNEVRGTNEEHTLLNIIDGNIPGEKGFAHKILDLISPEAKEILELNSGIIHHKRISYKQLAIQYGKSNGEIKRIVQESKETLKKALRNKKMFYTN